MQEKKKGMLLVLSGPSGVGKGTLADRLLKEDSTFRFSVSVATRAPRPGEIDGVHYHFLTEEQYDELLAKDAFLEHADVHGHRYGTLKEEVNGLREQGINVLLDIDTVGAINVMAKEPDCVSVFILPPSFGELRRRLIGRHTESEADVEKRLANARGEVEKMPLYRYTIINDELDVAYTELLHIVEAQKLSTACRLPILTED